MNTDRNRAERIGVFFLFEFAGVMTVAVITPILDDSNYLSKTSTNEY
jgi:hypothetical protein